ncbi:Nucleolar protein 13 [Lecanora helva]
MGRHSTRIADEMVDKVTDEIADEVATESTTPPPSPLKKRKREEPVTAEIEVDVAAPEPPSKKALRKAKKGKTTPAVTDSQSQKQNHQDAVPQSESEDPPEAPPSTISKRSEYSIWLGNLPWTFTKLDLRAFLTSSTTTITDPTITRLHMPPPSKHALAASRQKIKPHNQGFAYVDFSSKEAMDEALALSEKLVQGRRVLIKDARSFEGRPEKLSVENGNAGSDKPPSKRIFVGNLAFDVTREILQDHFARCGEVTDVHVATFEDSGKCKGYAWVEFGDMEAAGRAVRGWVDFKDEDEGGDDEEEEKENEGVVEEGKKKKAGKGRRKWWVNRLAGRPLRMEFAEGKDVRYKKRYGKEGTAAKKHGEVEPRPVDEDRNGEADAIPRQQDGRDKEQRQFERKRDARTIKPGAALAAAPRLTGSIVESQGKKTVFV